jgi:thiosulfate reductase cytochrome b subunit
MALKVKSLNNVESKEGGEGKIDWSRLLGFIVAAIGLTYLAYSLFTGLITFDDFIKMVDNLIEVAI